MVGAYNLIFRTRRRRQDVGAVVRPHRQSQVPQPVCDPPGGGRPVHRRRRRASCSSSIRPAQRFRALDVPYNGSFFGVTGDENAVLVFGLRGNVYRSDDARQDAGRKVDAGLPATIVGGAARCGGAIAAGRCQRARRRLRRRRHARSKPLPLESRRCRSPASPTPATEARAASGPRGVAVAAPSRCSRKPAKESTMAAVSDDLDQMPVVRELADFDRNSGNLLERLVFNNRLVMVIVCAMVTRGARLLRGDAARAERELREDDSAEPAVHQELPRRTRRTCAASATRCASWSRTPTATSSTPRTSRR